MHASATALTGREIEVLSLAGAGLTSRQIGRRLDITERTVSKHLEHIYDKLDVCNRAAAVLRLLQLH